jgi:HYDIN/CFA65/VesB-like, Ig-like domain
MSEQKNKDNLRHHKKKQPWPIILLVAGGLLLIIVAVSAFNQPSQPKAAVEISGSASLKVDQEKVDLGDVKLGKTVAVTFQLTNVGDKTLKFSEAPYIEVLEGC